MVNDDQLICFTIYDNDHANNDRKEWSSTSSTTATTTTT